MATIVAEIALFCDSVNRAV